MSDHPSDPAPRARPPGDVPGQPAGAPPDWDALARLLAGEQPAASDAASAAEAEQWMAAHPDEAAHLAEVDRLAITALGSSPAAPPVDVEAALARVKAAFPGGAVAVPTPATVSSAPSMAGRGRPALARPRPAWATRRLTGAGALAAALLAAAGVVRWQQTHPRATDTPLVYTTGVGARDSVRLRDGTHVVLGPASTLTLDTAYGRGARQVALVGEAYFHVAHDERQPFTVTAGPAVVRDLGTAFVVRAGAGDRVVVAVTEGLVRLAAAEPGVAQPPARPQGGERRVDTTAVLLRAGDRGLVARPAGAPGRPATARVSRLATPAAASSTDDLAWTTGRLVFRDAPLSEVADALRRWYGVELRVTDPALAGRPLTASFQGEPVDEVLRVVGLAIGARLDRRGDTVFVRGTR